MLDERGDFLLRREKESIVDGLTVDGRFDAFAA